MGERAPADGPGVGVADRPADVVVAAHVGGPGGVGRDRRHPAQRLHGQPRVPRREARPQHHHELVVVGQLALRPVAGVAAEVGHEVLGRDDRLGLEDRRRRGHLDQGVQGLHEVVHLGLVHARGAQPLPHERHGVHPEDLDPPVGQPQHRVEDSGEDVRVGVVEVPLVAEERRPHPRAAAAAGRADPGERAGRAVREDVADRGLVRVGHVPVVEGEVEVRVRRVAGQPRLRPRVLAGGVVQHEVDAQAHPALAQRPGRGLQVVHGADPGVDGAVVHDGVAAVVLPRPRLEQGHQVQVAHAQLGEVVQPLGQGVERAAEAVGVGDVADGARLLVPARLDLAAPVGLAQLRRPLRRRAEREPDEAPDQLVRLVVAVERLERAVQVEEPQVEAGQETDGLRPAQCVLGLLGDDGPQPLQGCRCAATAFGVGAQRDHAHILPSRMRPWDVLAARPRRAGSRRAGHGTLTGRVPAGR